ncbi:NDR1/HIN1-like protein 3 [Pyrus communis]|uniref:NDR1/HIN1-like protein 3 n=1 Tax=Pyrus communis TaxID=23211 RepID=UPI0035BEBE73
MSATTTSDCENPRSLAMSATERSPPACNKICAARTMIMVFAAMIGLVLWFTIKSISKYKCPDFTINGAYLSQFSYTESNLTLSYNLALNITLTNPKKKIFHALIDVEVSAYYQDKRLGQVTLVDRSMSTSKKTTVFQNVVVRGHDMLFEEFVTPAADLYSIDVVITFQDKNYTKSTDLTESKILWLPKPYNVHWRGDIHSGEVIYNLRLPLSFNGTSWDADKTTHCPIDN